MQSSWFGQLSDPIRVFTGVLVVLAHWGKKVNQSGVVLMLSDYSLDGMTRSQLSESLRFKIAHNYCNHIQDQMYIYIHCNHCLF